MAVTVSSLLVLFIASFLGIVFAILVIGLIIYLVLQKKAKELNLPSKEKLKKMIDESEYEAHYRHKSISGLTNILIPRIKQDFPNFNEKEFYNKVETSIMGILNSLSSNKVSKLNELAEIRSRLESEIEARIADNIKEEYEDVVFHEHALKSYKNEPGVLEIEVNSSLEFFYSKKIMNQEKVKKKEYKKQTTFTTSFVYIYDPDKYTESKTTLCVHCPNCSAPLKNIKTRECTYCKTIVEDINLKSWYITKYKENF